jgi:hypothetical protein
MCLISLLTSHTYSVKKGQWLRWFGVSILLCCSSGRTRRPKNVSPLWEDENRCVIRTFQLLRLRVHCKVTAAAAPRQVDGIRNTSSIISRSDPFKTAPLRSNSMQQQATRSDNRATLVGATLLRASSPRCWTMEGCYRPRPAIWISNLSRREAMGRQARWIEMRYLTQREIS